MLDNGMYIFGDEYAPINNGIIDFGQFSQTEDGRIISNATVQYSAVPRFLLTIAPGATVTTDEGEIAVSVITWQDLINRTTTVINTPSVRVAECETVVELFALLAPFPDAPTTVIKPSLAPKIVEPDPEFDIAPEVIKEQIANYSPENVELPEALEVAEVDDEATELVPIPSVTQEEEVHALEGGLKEDEEITKDEEIVEVAEPEVEEQEPEVEAPVVTEDGSVDASKLHRIHLDLLSDESLQLAIAEAAVTNGGNWITVKSVPTDTIGTVLFPVNDIFVMVRCANIYDGQDSIIAANGPVIKREGSFITIVDYLK